MLNIRSRRGVIPGKSSLSLYLEMKDAIRKALASGASSFSRASSGCEYWRRPAVNAGAGISRHRKGLLAECADTNLVVRNTGSNQQYIGLYYNGLLSGCIAAYNFEDNCNDLMGNYNGTPTGVTYGYLGSGTDPNKRWGKSGYFNGDATPPTAMVNIGKGGSLDNMTELTICCLFYLLGMPATGYARIYEKGSPFYIIFRDQSGNNVRLQAFRDYSTTDADSRSTVSIALNTLHHLAITYSQSGDRKFHIYLNGSEVSYSQQTASVGTIVSDAASNGFIGNAVSGQFGIYGYMDAFEIYSRALTPSEIAWKSLTGNFVCTCERGMKGASNDQVDTPHSLAVDSSFVYLPDTYNNRVKKLLKDFSYVAKIGSQGTGDDQFSNCCGAAQYEADDYLIVADTDNSRLVKRKKSDLSFVAKYGSYGLGDDQFYHPHGICCDATHIYVPDTHNNRLKEHLKSDFSYVAKIGSQGSGDDQFNLPFDACCDETYVYVADTHNHRVVKRLESDLSFIAKVGTQGSGDDQFRYPFGICCDETYLYIADTDNNRIVKRKKSDLSFVAEFGSWGFGTDKFYEPRGIRCDGDNLYVADSFNNRLVKLRKNDFSFVCQKTVALYENGYGVKCKESGGSAQRLYQVKTLTAEDYIVSFLAYTDGSPVTSSDVVPFADTAFTNEIAQFNYESVGNGVYMCWGKFTATAANWNVGAEVKANKTVWISLLTCIKAGTSMAGGPYPRSLIANETNSSVTRQADSLTVSGSDNFQPSKGTLDIELYPLFPSSLSSGYELYLAHFYGGSGQVRLYKNDANKVTFRVQGDGDDDSVVGTITWNRGDRVKIRAVWNCRHNLDGANYMLMYGRVNDGDWSQIGACSTQPTAPSSNQTLYVGRAGSSAGYEADSFISWLRIYDRPLLKPTW